MRVLIVRLSALGDVVQSLGAVQALAAARPEWDLVWVVQREFVPVLACAGLPLQLVPHARRPALAGLLRTRAALRARRCDVALDLQGNWKSALVARLSGAGRVLGAAAASRQAAASAMLATQRIACSRHPARMAQALVRELVPGLPESPPRLVAPASELARETAEVRALGVDPTRPFRVFVVTDPRDPRAWWPSAMVREERAAPLPALWLYGPGEAHLAAPAGVRVLRHAGGELARLVALGTLLALAGGVALGPDRGATHVLCASGARTIVLYGPQDPESTAPLRAQVVRRREPPPCMPCRSRVCRWRQGPVCMDFSPALESSGTG